MISQSENLHPLPPTRSGLHPYILTVYSQPVMLRAWFAFLLPKFYTSSTLLPLVLSIYRSLLHTFDPSTFTLARSCSLLLPLPCCLRTACLYKNANCNKLASQQKLVWSGRSSAVQRLCAFDAENAWDFADAWQVTTTVTSGLVMHWQMAPLCGTFGSSWG